MEGPGPARRTRLRKGEGDRLRVEVLEAAERLLVRAGEPDAVSVKAVAAEVGVTTAAVYLHFTDRAALLHAVSQRQFEALAARMRTAVEVERDPVDRVRAIGRTFVAFGLEHPAVYRILFLHRSDAQPDPERARELLAASGLPLLLEQVKACIAAGRFPDRDPWLITVTLLTGAAGVTSLLLTKPGFPWPDRDELIELALEIRIRGLETMAPSA